eukprot:174071-Pleurochrysis_carterae.AAC.1
MRARGCEGGAMFVCSSIRLPCCCAFASLAFYVRLLHARRFEHVRVRHAGASGSRSTSAAAIAAAPRAARRRRTLASR